MDNVQAVVLVEDATPLKKERELYAPTCFHVSLWLLLRVLYTTKMVKEKCFDYCICFSAKKMQHDQRVGDLIIVIWMFYRVT